MKTFNKLITLTFGLIGLILLIPSMIYNMLLWTIFKHSFTEELLNLITNFSVNENKKFPYFKI